MTPRCQRSKEAVLLERMTFQKETRRSVRAGRPSNARARRVNVTAVE